MSDNAIKEEVTVLFHAALIGRTDVLQNAISVINSSCSDEETIALISSGRIEDGATPLHLAALAGHSDVIRYLLNAHASLDAAPQIGTIFLNKRPYDVAVESAKQAFHVYMFEQIAMGRVESISRLLRGGVPVAIRDGFKLNESTLHWACSFDNIEVAKLLLSSGSSVDIKNSEEQTALHLACKAFNIDMIKLLLSEGASISAKDSAGKVPMELLPQHNDEVEKLLTNPPEPSFVLRDAFQKSSLCSEESNGMKKTGNGLNMLTHATPENVLQNQNHIAIPNSSTSAHSSKSRNMNGLYEERSVLDDLRVESKERGSDNEIEKSVKESPLLVFWPPVKRQTRSNTEPLVLSSLQTVLIHVACDSTDMHPILIRSGLVDVLERFNLKTSVKRPARDGEETAIPTIRFCVDVDLCPGRSRFEIVVRYDFVTILGSDPQGGLYGLYTFMQLLQLHSESFRYDSGESTLQLPSVSLTDWPDVVNRAVMWSYKESALSSFSAMRDIVELLSRLRVNLMLLIIDTTTIEDAERQSRGIEMERDEAQQGGSALQSAADGAASSSSDGIGHDLIGRSIVAIDEVCDGVCVELVPTVVIESIAQRLSLALLRCFSHSMICISFKFDSDSVRAELLAEKRKLNQIESVSETECEDACFVACDAAFQAAVVIGFSAVTFSCSKWTKKVCDPLLMAYKRGLHASEKDHEILCPSPLRLTPVYFAQEFIRNLQMWTRTVFQEGHSLAVFPAFTGCDFLTPFICIKYFCALHAGFSWNADALGDMILKSADNENSLDAAIIGESISLLLFTRDNKEIKTDQSDQLQAILKIFTGQIYHPNSEILSLPKGSTSSSTSTSTSTPAVSRSNSIHNTPSPTEECSASPSPAALADVERQLWSLLVTDGPVHYSPFPSKSDASHLLRHYRKLLAASKWRSVPIRKGGLLTSFAFGTDKSSDVSDLDMEVDSYFSTIQLMCVFCRGIVLAHNAREKPPLDYLIPSGEIMLGHLMSSLSPGTKSDIANALLAALDHCSVHAKRRFVRLQIQAPYADPSASTGGDFSPGSTPTVRSKACSFSADPSRGLTCDSRQDHTEAARAKYLNQCVLALPALAVLKTISDRLPLPHSIEDALSAIFIAPHR